MTAVVADRSLWPELDGFAIVLTTDRDAAAVSSLLGLGRAVVNVDEPYEQACYAVADIAGGSLLIETTGFREPEPQVLAALSSEGRRAACVRDNVLAHVRFGCAEDGQSLFDEDEFWSMESRAGMPASLHRLHDLVWDEDGDESPVDHDWVAVALAMAWEFTGLHASADDVRRAFDNGLRLAPGHGRLTD